MPKSRQRILLAIGSARAGGAEGQIIRLGVELAVRGHSVRFVFSEAGGVLTQRLDAAGIPWSIARRSDWPNSSTLRRILGIVNLARILVSARPTAVMAWLPTAIWPTLLLARWLTRATLIAGIRGEIVDDLLGWQRRPLRRAFARADRVAINSPHLEAVAARWGVQRERVELVPNGVTLPEAVADPGVEPPIAVVVANYRWYKGHDTLIDALALVSAPVVVRLCGEGDTTETALRASMLGVEDKVVFVPDPADVRAELRLAQFAIHPSTQEGLSNAILEELSTGLPVVAASVGGNPLLVTDATGRLVPASDAAALAAAIDELAGDAAARVLMGKAARAHAAAFDWTSCATRYESLMSPARSQS